MDRPSDQDRVNRRIYAAANVTRWYVSQALDPIEIVALLRHQAAYRGKDVLDLGVGTGRSTRYLAPLAGRYVGVDFSSRMIGHMKTAFPDVDTRLMDMRDLTAFEDDSFDSVFALCNLIDAVGHDDRLRTLAEIRRVLRPGGLFVFTSHNLGLTTARSGPRLQLTHNPATQLLHVLTWIRSLVNHTVTRKLRRFEADYALLNDSGHDYAALHYYISRARQGAQLDASGFHPIEVIDTHGNILGPDDDDSGSPCLLYVAERRP